ncbi:MAG: hypothetical protein ACPGNV_18130 [Mangrovicoccus sp.]
MQFDKFVAVAGALGVAVAGFIWWGGGTEARLANVEADLIVEIQRREIIAARLAEAEKRFELMTVQIGAETRRLSAIVARLEKVAPK